MTDQDRRPSRDEAEAFWQTAQGDSQSKESGNDHTKIAEQALAQVLGDDWEEHAEPADIMQTIQWAQNLAKGKDLQQTISAIQAVLNQ